MLFRSPADSSSRSRRKNATPGGSSSLIDPPSPPTKDKVKKLSWFERTLLCMNIATHKENYAAYVERKNITHNQGVLLKEIDALSGKGKAPKGSDGESDSAESDPSDITIPYTKWRNESVNWAAFGEITSQPSSSVRIGEQSTTSGAAGDGVDVEDDGDDSAYSEESQDSEDSA